MPRITDFFICIYEYVFGRNLSLVTLCDSDFGIIPVDDVTIGITCAAFCFHIALISFASPWHLFCLSVIVLFIIIIIFIIVVGWAGHVARMGEWRGAYRVLVGKPEGKRPLGRPRRRFEDNIRMDLQEVGLGYEDWIGLAQDRDRWRALVSAVRNLRIP